MLEKDIQTAIKEHLTKLGICFIENKNEFVRGRRAVNKNKGLPDLQIIHNGKTMFIELKAIGTTSRTYDEQVKWRQKLNGAGVKSVICYGYDEAKQIVDEFIS